MFRSNSTDKTVCISSVVRFRMQAITSIVLGTSGQWRLEKSETNEDPFERNQFDNFTFSGKPDLGELTSCRIEHDDKGFKSGWHLEHVKISQDNKQWFFPCNQVTKRIYLIRAKALLKADKIH